MAAAVGGRFMVQVEAGTVDGGGQACSVAVGVRELGGQASGVGVYQVFALCEDLVELSGLACVEGEVRERVGVGSGVVAAAIGAAGDLPG